MAIEIAVCLKILRVRSTEILAILFFLLTLAIFDNNNPIVMREKFRKISNMLASFKKSFNLLKTFFDKPISADLQQRQNSNYLLISRPTCGRTWLREMLAYIFDEISGIKIDRQNLHTYLYKYSELDSNIPSIKPTHELFEGREAYSEKKVILLVRDPRDAFVSNGLKKIAVSPQWQGKTLSDFIEKSQFLDTTITFYNDWAVNRDAPQDLLLIRYEDLVFDTIKELEKTIDFLGLHVPSQILQRAIDNTSLDKLKKAMQQSDLKTENSVRIRKGKAGSYKEELTRHQIMEIDAKINRLLDPSYGYNYDSFAEVGE